MYQKIPSLYTIIGTVGAGYLIYLGVSGIFADPEIKDLAAKETQTLNLWQSFTGGLMANKQCRNTPKPIPTAEITELFKPFSKLLLTI